MAYLDGRDEVPDEYEVSGDSGARVEDLNQISGVLLSLRLVYRQICIQSRPNNKYITISEPF